MCIRDSTNSAPEPIKTVDPFIKKPNNVEKCFKTAADRPELYLPLLKNKTIAIVANQTSLLEDKTHLVDFLVQNNIKIKHIFAPEHGFRAVSYTHLDVYKRQLYLRDYHIDLRTNRFLFPLPIF